MCTKYNAAPIRRHVRRTELTPGRVQHFVSKSFTRSDVTIEHKPVVDLQSGFVSCTCEDFTFRHARHEPNVFETERHCKHIARALENCERNGLLKDSKPVAPVAPVAAETHHKPDLSTREARQAFLEQCDALL